MSTRGHSTKKTKRQVAYIYAVVFHSTFSVQIIFVLFVSFFIQPIHLAYAQETAENELTTEASALEDVETVFEESVDLETEQSTDEESAIDDAYNVEVDDMPTKNQPKSTTTLATESPLSDPSVGSTTNSSVRPTTTESIDTDPNPTASTTVSTTTSSSTSDGTNSPDTGEAEQATSSSATTTEEATSSSDDEEERQANDDEADSGSAEFDTSSSSRRVQPVENFVSEQNFYQFSKQACVSVGDGAYHCSANSETAIDSQSVVYSDIGENGSKEIFIKTARGGIKQVSDSLYDDTAPSYDPESMMIAWQRLIQGRYQIVMYDLVSGEEKQLTFERTNNMEPAVSKAGVVWQSWDGNDWEIKFYDGEYTEQLTDNQTQDVAPTLEDEYIIWTVIGENVQVAQVYSLVTNEVVTISNHEGGSIINPRFVLVYDTQFDNGDIVTQGFDPETGFSAPIAAQPGQEPVDFPDSDSTGEVRALIQNKSTKETGEVVNNDIDTGSSTNVGSGAETEILNLKASSSESVEIATTSSAIESDTEIVEDDEVYFELTDYDLIITKEEVDEAFAALESASSSEEGSSE